MPSIFQNLENKVATAAKQDTAQASLTATVTALNLLHADLATQATSSKQDTGNALLASIDGKLPALSSGALPVTLPAGQIATLTPPAAIVGYATETTTAAQLALDTAGVRGVRRDADTSAVADGQPHPLATNAVGRLKVSSWPGAYTLGGGNITGTAQNVVADVSRVSNVTAELVGTFIGVNVTFETSLDGTNWKAEQGIRSSGASIESASGVLSSPVAYSWEFSVNGKNFFRVRSTAYTSGTATVNIAFGAYATEPFVYTPTHSVQQNGTWTFTPITGTTYNAVTTAAALAAVIKSSAGNLYELTVSNVTAATIYVKLYNKATVGLPASDIPVMTIPVTAGSFYTLPTGTVGKRFATGIAVGVTAAAAATDTTAVTAGAVINATYL